MMKRNSLPLVLGTLALGAFLPAASGAQVGDPDEKPDLELPEVVIEGIDESLLGVGDTPTGQDPETKALPLAVPPVGAPADVRVSDPPTNRTQFADMDPPTRPSALTVRGYLTGGTYTTIRAGLDAKHSLSTGGVFGDLGGVASEGWLVNGAWSRTSALLGIAVEPSLHAGLRGGLSHRSREQDLPTEGALTPELNPPDLRQTFRRWGGDFRYRYEGDSGFLAGLTVLGSSVTFQQDNELPKQNILEGTIDVALKLPLSGRLWGLDLDLAVGGREEEDQQGQRTRYQRFRTDLVGRVAGRTGWGFAAGLGFYRYGDDEVFGPIARLSYQAPPVWRVWVQVSPYLEDPPLPGFLEEALVASGTVGQAAEKTVVNTRLGFELQPSRNVSFDITTALRKTDGFIHMVADGVGLYTLSNMDSPWVLDGTVDFEWKFGHGFRTDLGYRLLWVEGSRVSYVRRHRGSAGLGYRGPVDVGVKVAYLGSQWPSPEEASSQLPGAWLLSADFGVEIANRWWVSLVGENLTDREYFDYAEYVAPGRQFIAGIRYAF